MGNNDKASRATIELVPETEATKVTVTHDEWAEDVFCSDVIPAIREGGEDVAHFY
jgi:hypothetical protein